MYFLILLLTPFWISAIEQDPGVLIHDMIDPSTGHVAHIPVGYSSTKNALIFDGNAGNTLFLEIDQSKRVTQLSDKMGLIAKLQYSKHPDGTRQTTVTNAIGQPTLFTYDQFGHLLTKQQYSSINQISDGVLRCDRYVWSSTSNQDAKVIAHAVEDADHLCHVLYQFAYDEKGQLSSECVIGNLTGNGRSRFLVNESGQPADNAIEKYTTYYRYDTQGRLHLKQEDNGKAIRLYYLDDESLPFMETLFLDEKPISRTFYHYDAEERLVRSLEDDGTGHHEADLTRVTHRQQTTWAFSDDGLSLEKTYAFWAPDSGHFVEKQKELHYLTSDGKVHRQDVYDQEGAYAFSRTHLKEGSSATLIDPAGQKTIAQIDAAGRTTMLTKGTTTTHFSYDIRGNKVREVTVEEDEKIADTHYRYDPIGRLVSLKELWAGETSYSYNALGHRTEEHGPLQQTPEGDWVRPVSQMTYDLLGNCLQKITPTQDIYQYTYNSRCEITEITQPTGVKEVKRYHLDGNLTLEVDSLGHTQQTTYDGLGRMLTSKHITADNQLVSSRTFAYTPLHLSEEQHTGQYPIRYTYGIDGQVASIQQGERTTLLRYDTLGYRASVEEKLSNQLIRTTTFEHDPLGRLLEERSFDQTGYETSGKTVRYDLNGRPAFEAKWGAGMPFLSEELTYDGLGRVKKKTNQFGAVTHYSYSTAIGERNCSLAKVIQTDDEGYQTISTLDSFGHPTTVEKLNPYGIPIRLEKTQYDLEGFALSHAVTDPIKAEEQTTQWTYGSLHQVRSVTEAAGTEEARSTHYTFNGKGLLTKCEKPSGISLYFSYDESGHLVELTSSDASVHYQFTYDGKHSLTVFDLLTNTQLVRFFDSNGRIIQEQFGETVTVAQGFDAMGRRTNIDLPDGSRVEYRYPEEGGVILERYTSSNHLRYSSHLSQDGDLELIGGLGKQCWERNDLGLVQRVVSSFHEDAVLEHHHAFITKRQSDTESAPVSYTYDRQGELTSEGCATYSYDTFGNRTKRDGKECQHNLLGELLSDPKGSYQYDLDGQLIHQKLQDEKLLLEYDALGRLVSIERKGKWKETYSYDVFHRRLSKTSLKWKKGRWKTSSVERYLWLEDRELGSIDEDGLVKEFLASFGEERLVAIELGEALYAPLQDIQGSVAALVDPRSHDIAERYSYSAFGEELSPSTLSNPWRFSAKRRDKKSGLLYFGKRYYSPLMGAWITKDPAGLIDGHNRYNFVHNNPLLYRDPTGLFSVMDGFWEFCHQAELSLQAGASTVMQWFNAAWTSICDFELMIAHSVGEGLRFIGGYYSEEDCTGVWGEKELHPKVRITAINGILNSHEDWVASLDIISSTHGGTFVHYIYSGTQGVFGDIGKCIYAKLGFTSSRAKELAKLWRSLIQEMGGVGEGGTILHYTHSLGGTDTLQASHLLSAEERAMIHVYTFGSATLIQEGVYQNVTNYVCRRDGVPLFDLVSYLLGAWGVSSNVIFIGSHYGVPLVDHFFANGTYNQVAAELGQQFLNNDNLFPNYM